MLVSRAWQLFDSSLRTLPRFGDGIEPRLQRALREYLQSLLGFSVTALSKRLRPLVDSATVAAGTEVVVLWETVRRRLQELKADVDKVLEALNGKDQEFPLRSSFRKALLEELAAPMMVRAPCVGV